jgi:hypothetical protein
MAQNFKQFFAQKNIQILFATAPTGLGHIRVTEALKSALGTNIQTETIGIMNPSSQLLHRIMSRSLILRYFMEVFQSNPVLEYVASAIYRRKLRTGNRAVRKYLVDLIRNASARVTRDGEPHRRGPLVGGVGAGEWQDPRDPKRVLIVATHFGLAHQIASIRKKVERLTGTKLILAVIVTDDSPQKMWAVDKADYIFVPSAFCKKGILRHLGKRVGSTKVLVSPYPVSKEVAEGLTDFEYKARLTQTDPKPGAKLQIIIPVSGAAVQLSYFQNIISKLRKKKDVAFTIVSRNSPYTRSFLRWCNRQMNVEVKSSKSDHEVVSLYNKELKSHVFSVEITKPSEQTFKALLTPKMQGGVTLLFSGAVGRQEYDNIHFLERHGLLPNAKDTLTLDALWFLNQKQLITKKFLDRAKKWRGILLPRIGMQGADAIVRLYETGILHAMSQFNEFANESELKSDGAMRFWKRLAKELQS